MNTVPHKDPRDIGKLNGRLELVTLAAEDPLNGIKLAKFFIVPKFHIFEPEHASKLEEDPVKKTATRRLHEEMEKVRCSCFVNLNHIVILTGYLRIDP